METLIFWVTIATVAPLIGIIWLAFLVLAAEGVAEIKKRRRR